MFFSQKLQFHNSGFDAIDDAVTAIVGTSWDPKGCLELWTQRPRGRWFVVAWCWSDVLFQVNLWWCKMPPLIGDKMMMTVLFFLVPFFFHQFVKWVTSKTFDEASSDMSNNGSVSCFYFQRATIRWNQRKHARGMILPSKAERKIIKRWWFQILLIFNPIWWRLPFWTSIFIIFSIGLVHPPTRKWLSYADCWHG